MKGFKDFSEEEKCKIYDKFIKGGFTQRDIAKKYETHQTAISMIVKEQKKKAAEQEEREKDQKDLEKIFEKKETFGEAMQDIQNSFKKEGVKTNIIDLHVMAKTRENFNEKIKGANKEMADINKGDIPEIEKEESKDPDAYMKEELQPTKTKKMTIKEVGDLSELIVEALKASDPFKYMEERLKDRDFIKNIYNELNLAGKMDTGKDRRITSEVENSIKVENVDGAEREGLNPNYEGIISLSLEKYNELVQKIEELANNQRGKITKLTVKSEEDRNALLIVLAKNGYRVRAKEKKDMFCIISGHIVEFEEETC